MIIRRYARFPIMLAAGVTLALAVWAGLVRMGWPWPAGPAPLAQHGPLMLAGFFGTVITLERAVALDRRWPYLAAGVCALGALAVLAQFDQAGRWLIVAGSVGLVAIFAVIVRRQPDAAHVTMGLGALWWVAGNVLWALGWPVAQVVAWWLAFLVLTVAGERLELARLVRLTRSARAAYRVAAGLCAAGPLVALIQADAGARVSGLGLLALGLWLARYDIARRTVRQQGLTRFIAACLLAGYAWLIVGGVLWLIAGGGYSAGPWYDALLHVVLVGFVFSMIFGHAPVILTGVLGLPLVYHPRYYVPLGLLHLALAARVAGDLAGWYEVRLWGGLGNALAILLFIVSMAWTVRAAAPARGA